MKAAPFDYSRPADIDEACALLAADDSARVIAGGQTLVPMMAMRLARPTRLIDISRIAALSYVREEATPSRSAPPRGNASSSATRWSQASCRCSRTPCLSSAMPRRARAAPSAARSPMPIPAAELPLIAVTLDADLSYRAGGKTATIAARDFFTGLMTTALPAGAVPDRRAVSGLARQSRASDSMR